MELTLNRKWEDGISTVGMFGINGVDYCFSMEDVEREMVGQPVASWKVKSETAIPRGRYQVLITMSTRFGRTMPQLMNVPGFDGIRIHKGNTAKDTEGCILLGRNFDSSQPDMISNSAVVFDPFYQKLETALNNGEECWITITGEHSL